MAHRPAVQLFDQYQKYRFEFAKNVAELAIRHQNIPLLDQGNVLVLLKPLMTDSCKQIQHYATIAIGRILQHDTGMVKKFLEMDMLPTLITNFKAGNKQQKISTLFVLRSIGRHNEETAMAVIKSGALEVIAFGLEDYEPTVKESAAWAAGYIARHSKILAQSCVDAGVLPLLTMALQEPHLSLKQVAASAISDIAKHETELAQNVVDAGAIPNLAKNLHNLDEKVKRQVLAALASCAKHSLELAEIVIDSEVFPAVLMHMAHACPQVRKNATNLIKEIAKQSLELAQFVVNGGGIGALMEVLHQKCEDSLIPSITAIGFIAGQSDQMAMAVLSCKAIITLGTILYESQNDCVLSVTAWTIGQIGKHSPEHSRIVATANIFPRLVQLFAWEFASEDLKFKCKTALKQCLQKCLLISALEPILHEAPPMILKYVLAQYSKILPNDPKARRLFVTTGGLKKVQCIDAQPGSPLMEYITIINSCFPVEIVHYYSPGYPESLLDKVEQYSPQMMTILREDQKDQKEAQTFDHSPSQELQKLLVGP